MYDVMLSVYEVRTVAIRMSSEGRKRRDERLAGNLCLGCGKKREEGESFRRGDCDACYQACLRAMKAERVSQAELVREGKILEAGVNKVGRPPKNSLSQELASR